MEPIISHHTDPRELLSDRGAAFLSKIVLEVSDLMGIKKVNTTTYHPQTDGLVGRFHQTMTDMLAKVVEKEGEDWDTHIPYILFAYRTSLQQSTGESSSFLLYGRDAQPPTESALVPAPTPCPINLEDYKSQMVELLSESWELARQSIQKAQ